jgi:glutamine---fructose-6-phosphate transaminase (isomerizing)
MCGIIGIIINDDMAETTCCSKLLFDCLKQLQNRGYDSAGISTISANIQPYPNRLLTHKFASTSTENAFDLLSPHVTKHECACIGVGHTRWSTHGPKTTENSHPHVSMTKKFVVVHNGIIENYMELKSILLEKKFVFKSQTDTEVIANYLEYLYEEESVATANPSVVETCINNLVSTLKGTWGLVILCTDTPDTIYCTRHGSPLLISINETMCMVASEQSGFNGLVNNYFALENGDICIIDKSTGTLTASTHQSYEVNTVLDQISTYNPFPHPHWTIKEILEQPLSIDRAICMGGRIVNSTEVKLGGLMEHREEINKIESLIILGCGTSYNAGMLGVHYFKDLCNFNTIQLIDGADFDASDIPRNNCGNIGAILLSQSGETKDLHRCIQVAQQNNVFTLGVVNVVDSMIAREVCCGCYLNAGKEMGVASTKSFTSQCVVLSMVAIWIAQCRGINEHKRRAYIKDLYQLKTDVQSTLNGLEENVDKLTPLFSGPSCFVLGRGRAEAVAREGSLKIKEISYVHSESYSTASLKHGPFALLCENFPVIMMALDDEFWTKNENAYNEIQSRHATIISISDRNISDRGHVIKVPRNNAYKEVLASIVLQMLAYKLSVGRGINPDMPKNLAKVVTVE